jgi:hypothetical protein
MTHEELDLLIAELALLNIDEYQILKIITGDYENINTSEVVLSVVSKHFNNSYQSKKSKNIVLMLISISDDVRALRLYLDRSVQIKKNINLTDSNNNLLISTGISTNPITMVLYHDNRFIIDLKYIILSMNNI